MSFIYDPQSGLLCDPKRNIKLLDARVADVGAFDLIFDWDGSVIKANYNTTPSVTAFDEEKGREISKMKLVVQAVKIPSSLEANKEMVRDMIAEAVVAFESKGVDSDSDFVWYTSFVKDVFEVGDRVLKA